jgi:hypothetical protein
VNRRRFVVGAVGAGARTVGGPWLGSAAAATEDEIAYANFGASTEFLIKDLYTRALEAKRLTRSGQAAARRGRSAAALHARALSGSSPQQATPRRSRRTSSRLAATDVPDCRGHGHRWARSPSALLGVYQTEAATVTDPSYRVLYASLAASLGQQIGALQSVSGRRGAEPFPVAMDLEAASTALEAYLG